jgi:hypothetical protein
VKAGRIVACGAVIALIIVALQAGTVFKTLGTKVAAHIPASDPGVTVLPEVITLNLPGGTMTCRLDVRSYWCMPVPVLSPVRGAR